MTRVAFLVVCFVALSQTVFGLIQTSSNRNDISKIVSVASLAALLSSAPLAANAVTDFTGSYADPKHPNCLREIVMTGTYQAAISGTDGNPGCPPDGSGRPWNLVGTTNGDSIFVDFSPKAGPKDLKGVWESAPNPGIRWPDGNIWTVKAPTASI